MPFYIIMKIYTGLISHLSKFMPELFFPFFLGHLISSVVGVLQWGYILYIAIDSILYSDEQKL